MLASLQDDHLDHNLHVQFTVTLHVLSQQENSHHILEDTQNQGIVIFTY